MGSLIQFQQARASSSRRSHVVSLVIADPCHPAMGIKPRSGGKSLLHSCIYIWYLKWHCMNAFTVLVRSLYCTNATNTLSLGDWPLNDYFSCRYNNWHGSLSVFVVINEDVGIVSQTYSTIPNLTSHFVKSLLLKIIINHLDRGPHQPQAYRKEEGQYLGCNSIILYQSCVACSIAWKLWARPRIARRRSLRGQSMLALRVVFYVRTL